MNQQALTERPISLEEKIAQLVFVRIGSNLPPIKTVEDDEQAISKLLEESPIGGLVLFNGRWPATKDTLQRLQAQSKYPLLVGSDIERGVGQQVHGLPVFPHAMAFDHLGEDAESLVEQYARELAAEARECGIHITFAPVADVNTDPRNPIIATRAFSQSAERSAQLVSAYIRAAEANGLLTTAKHFPGHGNTHQDSHDSMPIVGLDREELAGCDLLPFRAAIEAGGSLIMSAHVAFPEIDPSGQPATLSWMLLTDLLRNEMGFPGVICTDSLLMAGVQQGFDSEGALAEAVLEAGGDILLDVANPQEVIASLTAAVHAGRLSMQRVDDAFERVWRLKNKAFSEPLSTAEGDSDFATQAKRLSQSIARRSITPYHPDSQLPQLDDEDGIMLLLLTPGHATLQVGEQPIAAALRAKFPNAEYAEVGPDCDEVKLGELTAQALAANNLVVALIVKPAAWHRFGLTDSQTALVEKLTSSRETTLISLGVPYILDKFENATSRWCTYSDVPTSQEAVVELLAGQG